MHYKWAYLYSYLFKMYSFKNLYLIPFILLFTSVMKAQVNNDDCVSALFIPNVTDFCSPSSSFTNVGAQASLSFDASCWRIDDHESDVWYSFSPSQPGVFIQLFGAAPSTTETIDNSALAIYQGNCSNLQEIVCSNVSNGVPDILERTLIDLVIGRVYYIRIGSSVASSGSFQLCLNQFNPIASPESDCSSAVVLCDKSSFFIENLQGVGSETNEVTGSCIMQEHASAWFTWTSENSGSLTFTIFPNNVNDPEEDLDFALYRLPDGLSDCANKELVRCMASGESQGQPFSQNEPCFGATGLREGEVDVGETQGCSIGDNNFLAPLQMLAGESYALVVNNFSESGFGFNIEFGGTGEFLGPTPLFEIIANDGFDCDKTIIFTDQSLDNTDMITDYSWNFGEGASPIFANEPGPHNILYQSFGTKRVALIVESSRGCTKTEILEFEVAACCADNSTLGLDNQNFALICADVPEGSIEAVGTGGLPEYLYDLNGDGFQPSPLYNGLASGDYTLTIQDRKGCTISQDITLTQPPPFIVNVTDDDSLDLGHSLQLDSEFDPSDRMVIYAWSPAEGLSCTDCPNPIATPPGSTTYILTITDQDGCTATDHVTLSTRLIIPIKSPNIISLSAMNNVNSFLWITGNIAAKTVKEYRVYDRWGSEMYSVSNVPFVAGPFQGWDGTFKGKAVNPGVYIWMARITFINKVTFTYYGDVTVIK